LRSETTNFDVIVIGGGPAGLSAAFWCADLGLKVAIFERESEFGGQLLWTFGAIENYLGVTVKNGRALRDLFLQQVENSKVTRFVDSPVETIDFSAGVIGLADGRTFSARAVVLATGVKRRTLDVPGEREFLRKGILASGQASRDEVAGKQVVIVGGGDAALENAVILSETAELVTVVHRREQFSARPDFVRQAAEQGNVVFRFATRVAAFIGDERVTAVDIADVTTGMTDRIDANHVLIRIGVEPSSSLFKGQIDLDERGYVRVGADCSTSAESVFAVGDVACPASPTIATAVGMGASAAKVITARLVRDRA